MINFKLIKLLTIIGYLYIHHNVNCYDNTTTTNTSNDMASTNKELLSSNPLVNNIITHSPKVTNEEIKETEIAIVKTSHKQEQELADKYHYCIKNYQNACPYLWNRIIENEKLYCIANSDYDGYCENKQSFESFSIEDKINFELSCNVNWPCKNLKKEICLEGRDYTNNCPNNFTELENGNCKPNPLLYDGVCINQEINFHYLTDEQKENWSLACDAYWPCKNENVNCYEQNIPNENESDIDNIYDICPKYWKLDINSTHICVPTNKYKGSCQYKKSFIYFTSKMKEDFAEKCNTRFDCKDTFNCERDYINYNCPLNWKEENKTCIAPSSFDLCLKKKLSIENLTTEDKRKFENDCSVQWPCKNEYSICKKINWNEDCPLDYVTKIENDNIICINEHSLENECKQLVLSKNSSEESKREIASNCNISWPCKEETSKYISIDQRMKKKQNINENGPISSEGQIFRKRKITIKEDTDNTYDIMK